jgi:hypothetical protein
MEGMFIVKTSHSTLTQVRQNALLPELYRDVSLFGHSHLNSFHLALSASSYSARLLKRLSLVIAHEHGAGRDAHSQSLFDDIFTLSINLQELDLATMFSPTPFLAVLAPTSHQHLRHLSLVICAGLDQLGDALVALTQLHTLSLCFSGERWPKPSVARATANSPVFVMQSLRTVDWTFQFKTQIPHDAASFLGSIRFTARIKFRLYMHKQDHLHNVDYAHLQNLLARNSFRHLTVASIGYMGQHVVVRHAERISSLVILDWCVSSAVARAPWRPSTAIQILLYLDMDHYRICGVDRFLKSLAGCYHTSSKDVLIHIKLAILRADHIWVHPDGTEFYHHYTELLKYASRLSRKVEQSCINFKLDCDIEDVHDRPFNP